MIHAAVKKVPVMGYEDESFLLRQIVRYLFPGKYIQMIGRLVVQVKFMLL